MSVCLAVALPLGSGVRCVFAAPSPASQPAPKLSAASAVLLDYATGKVLYSKDAYAVRAPASLTKMMTALLAIEKAEPTQRIKVSSRAASTPGATFAMDVGDVPPVWKLLYGMLLRSANNAAEAVAEGVGGSEAAFAKLMNSRAKQLGMSSTHFVNPHGLPAAGHVSSAFDLSLLARTALQNPTFAGIVRTREFHMTWNGKPRTVTNINKMLWRLPGADGVKTGYTDAAGYCLAADAAQGSVAGRGPAVSNYKEGERLVAVVLGCPSSDGRYADAQALLTWGLDGNWRAAAAPPSLPKPSTTYTVKAGDSLSVIALRNGIRLSDLAAANGLVNYDLVRAGQELRLP